MANSLITIHTKFVKNNGRKLIEYITFDYTGEGTLLCSGHVAYTGWLRPVGKGERVGLQGEGKLLEAIRFHWKGTPGCFIKARANVEYSGWNPIVGAEEVCGTQGIGRKLLDLEVIGCKFPTPLCKVKAFHNGVGWTPTVDARYYTCEPSENRPIEQFVFEYSGAGRLFCSAFNHEYGWLNSVSSGNSVGMSGRGLFIEQLKFSWDGPPGCPIKIDVVIDGVGELLQVPIDQPIGYENHPIVALKICCF